MRDDFKFPSTVDLIIGILFLVGLAVVLALAFVLGMRYGAELCFGERPPPLQAPPAANNYQSMIYEVKF